MATNPPRILVVDDEQAITDAICEALTLLGYRATSAPDGYRALAEVERERPDLVVLDVMMPRMDGLELLRTLRANSATSDIPVVLLTALGSDADVVRGIRSGATMYLTKPVEISRLTALLSAILGPGRAPASKAA